MFISFCGLDGCGKTTQVEFIKADKELTQKINISYVHAFKPAQYSKELKELAKRMNESFEMLYSPEIKSMSFIMDLLCMNFNNANKIRSQKDLVICEKYYLDTMIYSPLLGCNKKFIEVMNQIVIQPDLYIMLDIEPEESIKRILQRSKLTGKKIAPKENINVARMASKKFREYCLSNEKCIILDASLDQLTLHYRIKQAIINYIDKGKV